MSDTAIDWSEMDFRVIDQRVGAGIGGYDTVIRIYHRPTGLLVEVPRIASSQHHDREIALQMLETALTHPKCCTPTVTKE